MYSLIQGAKLNDIDPQAWLADVLERIAELLAAHVSNARLATIEGGRHFLPAAHPAELPR
jgi:hypothetical protein